jgi:hypothetical protein
MKPLIITISRYRKPILFLLTILAAITLQPCISNSFDGPFQSRNQFPLFSTFDAPFMESALIEDSLSVNLSYSSVYLSEQTALWSIGLDMEISELNLRVKKVCGGMIEIGADMPFLSINSGILDGALKTYHSAFGFPDYGRSERPDNKFLYEVKRGNVTVIKGESGNIGIGDIRLSAKLPVVRGDPAISVKGDIELPSGNSRTGYGNGSLDAGLALLMDKNLGGNMKSFINAGIIFPGDLRGYEKVDLHESLYGGIALEAAFVKDISFIGQIWAQNSPFPNTGIPAVDRTAVLLSFGGRYHSGSSSLDIFFTEDVNTAGAPDFTIHLSLRKKL